MLGAEGLEALGGERSRSGLEHDERERDPGVVRQREVDALDAELLGAGRNGAAQLEATAAARVGDDLGVVPRQAAGRAERLGQRLLGGEPGGQRLQRQRGLGRGEQPVAQRGRALEGLARTARCRRRRCRPR